MDEDDDPVGGQPRIGFEAGRALGQGESEGLERVPGRVGRRSPVSERDRRAERRGRPTGGRRRHAPRPTARQ